jgi:hypothetical protein
MSLSWIPDEPTAPPDLRARGRLHLRYEDVSQDGHLLIESLATALGAAWREVTRARPPELSTKGALPILSRMVIESGEAPISVHSEVEAEGVYQLGHTVGADGEVDRITLALWARAHGVVSRTFGPPPSDAGRPLIAGRVFAEHVFTRLFAPAAERKVRALDLGGRPFVPEARHASRDPESLLALPEGATALDSEPVADEVTVVFGLDHTDSNQHVNSLVYPRLFIEAALRRLFAHGRAAPRLARAIEIVYRKPCFAGDRVRVVGRTFMHDDRPGLVGALVADGDPPGARPRCTLRLMFDR